MNISMHRLLNIVSILTVIQFSFSTHIISAEKLENVGNQGILISTSNAYIWIDSVYEHVTDWDNFSYKPVSQHHEELQKDSQLKQVFSKTDTNRQGELVHLVLAGVARIRESEVDLRRNGTAG